MITLQQNLQRPFYIKHLLERLRYGKAAVAMRREAADLIEKMNEDSSNLSAQNSYQAMRIEELQRDLAAAQEALKAAEALAEQNAKDAKEAIAIAGFLFDAWEDGTPCFETDGESGMGASIGKAFKLSNEDFTRCTEFLNRVDPRGAAIAAAQEALKNHLHLDNHNAIVRQLEERALAAEERAERNARDAERKDRMLRECAYFMASFSEDCCIASSNLRQSCEHESAAIAAGEGK